MSTAATTNFRRTHRRQHSQLDVLAACGVIKAPSPKPLSIQPNKANNLDYSYPSCPRTPPSEPSSIVLIRTNNGASSYGQLSDDQHHLYRQMDNKATALPLFGKSVECTAYAAALEARNRSPSPPRRWLEHQSPVPTPTGISMVRRYTF